MLGLMLCRRLQSLLLIAPNSTTQFSSLINNAPIILIKPFLSTEAAAADTSNNHGYKQNRYSFTSSYLVHSCGLSPESAVSASKHVSFTSPEKPDSVLRLLRDHGFTNTQISKLIKRRPSLLLANADKILLPKLQFLHSIGISSSDLAIIVCRNPSLLTASLQKRIIPCYNVLKTLVNVNENIVKILKNSSWIFVDNLHNNAFANVSVLRGHGVPQSIIFRLVTRSPSLISLKAEKLNEHVQKTIEMGFNPWTGMFIDALQAFALLSKSTWEHKMEVYRRWGWSDDEIWLAVKRHPGCIKASEKKIMSVVGFLVNKMGWQPSAIARLPTVLSYSLEKRIIPRCSVVRVLLLKGLIKGEIPLSCVLVSTEKWFLGKYVTKYQDQVPQLLNIFRGEMDLLELGFGFEQTSGAKFRCST